MNSKVRKYLTVITLGLAGGSIYFLPYVKYIFYDAQLAAMHMSNTQSGLLLTMYTVGNMILYIPGGIIADKVSPKKALMISLLSTSALAYLYAFTMNFKIAMFIWMGLSFSTAFVFWSALMKAVRIIGTEEEQGFMYGLYYACNGITAALTNTLALNIYKTAGGDMEQGFFRAVLAGGSVAILAAVLLFFLMKDSDKQEEKAGGGEPKFNMGDVGKLLKKPGGMDRFLYYLLRIRILYQHLLFQSLSDRSDRCIPGKLRIYLHCPQLSASAAGSCGRHHCR